MSIEVKSLELKQFVSRFDTAWFLGNLTGLMSHIASGRAVEQLGKLSSPLRQLYFLGGLAITSPPANAVEINYTHEEWDQIVQLLNDIEKEYDKTFFPQPDEQIDEEWKKIRMVAMPSFLSYFNQGPLNYEEQTLNWVKDLYSPLDAIIEEATGLKISHFLQFYHNLDTLAQQNFRGFTSPNQKLRDNWKKYTKLSVEPAVEGMPESMIKLFEERLPVMSFVADHGIINRFLPEELVSETLTLHQVNKIISLICCTRTQTDFLFYTSTKPGNPLYEKPIFDIDDNMFQVFEVKQVLHAFEQLFENICSSTPEKLSKLVERKGKLLEFRIVELFKKFFGEDCEIFTGYYVDGCEQDILVLWREHAFIIEAKGYKLNEPFRDPDKAFVRIKNDFKSSIGYGYYQVNRVSQKFLDLVPLRLEDKNGNLIREIDTSKYEGNDYGIIVNLKSFGQIQIDLSTLLDIAEDDVYPWAVKFDDLEVFILTLIARHKSPLAFVNFLDIREDLHGKLLCSDELQICGGYLLGKIDEKTVESDKMMLLVPDLANLFDEQYFKGMGFKDEKYLKEKKDGKHIFW